MAQRPDKARLVHLLEIPGETEEERGKYLDELVKELRKIEKEEEAEEAKRKRQSALED